jgi:hypothetical protein
LLVRSPHDLHFPLLFCLLPGQVALALNPNSQRLAIGDEFWAIDIAAGNLGEIALDTGMDGSARIPELAELHGKGRGDVIKKVINSVHTGLNILQPSLTVS